MKKIVINSCWGSFDLSENAKSILKRKAPEKNKDIFKRTFRDNPTLVDIVERLGDAANGTSSKLKIVEIPNDIEWDIIDTGGFGYECVEEKHNKWY